MAAEIAVREQRHLGLDAEELEPPSGGKGDLGDLLGGGVGIDVGIAEEEGPSLGDHRAHRGGEMGPLIETEHVEHVLELVVVAPDQPANHRIGLAALDHQRGDHRGPGAHDRLGGRRGDAAALHDRVIELPVFVETRVVVLIDEFHVLPGLEPQPAALDPRLDHRRTPDEDRPS